MSHAAIKHFIITYDVTSMYTNMKFNDPFSSVREACVLIFRCVSENINFEFDEQYFKQIIGASMGAIQSPKICDIKSHSVL